MISHKHVIGWIVGGILVAILLIYFALSNGVLSTLLPNSPLTKGVPGGRGISPAPAGVSYDQADAATSTVVTGAPEAPGQSVPIPKEKIPPSAVKLSVSGNVFAPATFTVRAGETVVLSITAEDGRGHSFAFIDPALAAVSVGVGPHETRVITFEAPARPDNYAFRGTIGGDVAGTMVVK